MTDPAGAFRSTADAAQVAAGVISARHRGDLEGVNTLLAALDDRARAAGCLLLTDLAVALLAQTEGRDIGEVAADISPQLALLAPATGE